MTDVNLPHHYFIVGNRNICKHTGSVIIGSDLESHCEYDVQIGEKWQDDLVKVEEWGKTNNPNWKQEVCQGAHNLIIWHEVNNPNFEKAVKALKMVISAIV